MAYLLGKPGLSRQKRGFKRVSLLVAAIALVLVTVGAASADLEDGLKAYYAMEGDMSDATGNGEDGTNYGASTTTGKIGDALHVDSANTEYMETTAMLGNDYTGSHTINLWFRAQVDVDGELLNSVNDPQLFYNNNIGDKFVYRHSSGSEGQIEYSYQNQDSWEMITLVANNDTDEKSLYFDGDHKSTMAETGSFGGVIDIGRHSNDKNYITASFDEFAVWDRALSPSEIEELYNNSNGLKYPFSQVKNFTVVTADAWTGSAINNITVTVDGDTYTNTTGNTIVTDILDNETSTFDVTIESNRHYTRTYTSLNASENATLEAGLLKNTDYNDESSFNVTDGWTGEAIPFNLTVTSANYTAGTISFDLENNDYFGRGFTGYDYTALLNESLNASAISFRAFQLITGAELEANVTANDTTKTVNETFGLAAGNYTVTASKTGYYNQTYNITINPLDNRTINLEGLYNTRLNISPRDILNNNTITGNNITIESQNHTYTATADNVTSQTFNLIPDTYTVTVDSENRSLYNENKTITPGAQTHYAYTYAYNSLWVYAYDQADASQINNFNVTIQNEGNSYNNQTTTGVARIERIPTGEYTVTIKASGYQTSTYTITMADNSHQSLEGYLTISTGTFKMLVKDTSTEERLEDASVSQYGYVNNTLTLLASKNTDILGTVKFSYTEETSYYYVVNKANYKEKTFWLETLYDSYDILLEKQAATNPDMIDDDVHWNITRYKFVNNQTMWLEARVSSANGSLTGYSLTLETPNNHNTKTGYNAQGGVLNNSLFEGNAPFGSTATATLCYNSTLNKQENCYSRAYPIQGYTRSTGLEKLKKDTAGWGSLEKTLVAAIITMIFMAFMAAAGSLAGAANLMAALALLISLGLFTYALEWVNPWTFYGVALVAGMYIATHVGGET